MSHFNVPISLPSVTYVGFTGTPIDATIGVFGEVWMPIP